MNIRKPVRRLRRSSIPLGVPADLRIFITPNDPNIPLSLQNWMEGEGEEKD